MIYKITDEGAHAGHDEQGREFTFLTNANISKRAAYVEAMGEFEAGIEFGISDRAFDCDGNELYFVFAIYVLAASHVNRRGVIEHFVAVEERLDREAREVKS